MIRCNEIEEGLKIWERYRIVGRFEIGSFFQHSYIQRVNYSFNNGFKIMEFDGVFWINPIKFKTIIDEGKSYILTIREHS